MAEQLDISYVIKDAVKDYIVPKRKIYRLKLVVVEAVDDDEDNGYADNSGSFCSRRETKIIEIITEEEGDKICEDEDWFKSHTYSKLYKEYSYITEKALDIFIKTNLLRLESDFHIILLDYKQLA